MYNRNIQKWADGLSHHYNFEILVEAYIFLVLRYCAKDQRVSTHHLIKAVLYWYQDTMLPNAQGYHNHAFIMPIVLLVLAS